MKTYSKIKTVEKAVDSFFSNMRFWLVVLPAVLIPVWTGLLWYWFGPLLALTSAACCFLVHKVCSLEESLFGKITVVAVLTFALPVWVGTLAHFTSAIIATAALGGYA